MRNRKRLRILLLFVLFVAFLAFLSNLIIKDLNSTEKLARRFILKYHTLRIHNITSWMGVPILQNPCDMWSIQEIIYETRPDFIIETGSYKGGSALFLASVLTLINSPGKVITVDIIPQIDKVRELKLFKERIEFIEGNSVSPEIIDRIKNIIKNSKAMVMLDSDHHKEHVLKELRLYSQFVSKGCYLIIHDTAHNGNPIKTDYGQGPKEAVEEFLRENKNFISDRSREKYLLTFCPGGFLKRIK